MFNTLSHLNKNPEYILFLENFLLLLMTPNGCGLTGYVLYLFPQKFKKTVHTTSTI